MNGSSKKGFTLIELLVVISILGMMSSVVLSSVNNARDRAYDTATIQRVTATRAALATYRSINGVFPSPPLGGNGFPDTGTNFYGCMVHNKDSTGICGTASPDPSRGINPTFESMMAPYFSFSTIDPVAIIFDEDEGVDVSYVFPRYECILDSSTGRCLESASVADPQIATIYWSVKGGSEILVGNIGPCVVGGAIALVYTNKGHTMCGLDISDI